jgi:oligopeptide/dipeptide ABC transporter ATP-binding protein
MMEALKAKGIKKYYTPRGRTGLRGTLIKAVDGVDLTIPEEKIHSIVGETGSGKSTIGRIVAGLIEPTEGEVEVEGVDVFKSSKKEVKSLRKKVQIIFQDPYSSLNPRFTVRRIIEEPLKLNRISFNKEKINEILNKVGLTPPEDFLNRYPHELSGGQRQRVSIARSFVIEPVFVVADEPVSMLDASMRVSFLDLIAEIQRERKISMLLISHDISIAYYLSTKINVLYLGKIVEFADREELMTNPLHPYTKALIQAVPKLGPVERKDVQIKGNIMTSSSNIEGCRFRDRCLYAIEICKTEEPRLIEAKNGHFVACHLY